MRQCAHSWRPGIMESQMTWLKHLDAFLFRPSVSRKGSTGLYPFACKLTLEFELCDLKDWAR